MNATEIAAEIARLSALLAPAITDENSDWDGDFAAVLGHLADAQRDQGAALNVVANSAEGMEDELWGSVAYEAARSADILAVTAKNLASGRDSAQAAQEETAAAIDAARTAHFSTIFAETRPSSFFAALADLPGALTTR
ncbi:hypothetical protein OG884_18595 [Streptosporangium sp. NBC_01755]|uniref:hypothetical protein n=1 Tax=unclassified Streptosporangium TaxID=2632669 RepID=UPI002DD950BE|nr:MULTISPECIES: hypothetical protein [unclassified Streptosporangium]WSA23723.1 hypothetical protein OIE13_22540 [Streptosporangium sp. NBC_01810]WSD03817.1 hypothetical protein OG884_18595 [Streptosporangium sp. NBC_01755]